MGESSKGGGNGKSEEKGKGRGGGGGKGRKPQEIEKKRPRTMSSGSNYTDDMQSVSSENEDRAGGFNLIVRFAEEGGVGKMNPLELTKVLSGKCGELKFAKILRDGNLIIGCADELQMALAKQLTMIGKNRVVRVVRVGEQRLQKCRGVISGVALGVEEQELKENLVARGINILNIKRMTKGPDRIASETVLVEFEGERIPDRVFLGFMCFYVRAYIPKPMRCFKCQTFGHIAKVCKEKRRCPRCTGDHDYEECSVGSKLKCCSCGGAHSVTFGGCATMKREVEVQKVKVLDKLSYAAAVKVVRQREGSEIHEGGAAGGSGRRAPMERLRVERTVQDKGWVDKRRLVIFIAAAINSTRPTSSRTTSIQLIVKAAADHLDMVGLKWEEIEAEINRQSSSSESVGKKLHHGDSAPVEC